jgi:hypothetical protein
LISRLASPSTGRRNEGKASLEIKFDRVGGAFPPAFVEARPYLCQPPRHVGVLLFQHILTICNGPPPLLAHVLRTASRIEPAVWVCALAHRSSTSSRGSRCVRGSGTRRTLWRLWHCSRRRWCPVCAFDCFLCPLQKSFRCSGNALSHICVPLGGVMSGRETGKRHICVHLGGAMSGRETGSTAHKAANMKICGLVFLLVL